MLQRASEGEDKDLCEMCLATGIGADKCEAVCGNSDEDNTSDDEVVKSGSLVVSSSAADDRSVVVASATKAVSDLDTLTFKTSEEVTLNKVVLEKYGYSTATNLVSNVWLEDENGKEISNKSTPNTKGLVNLTIKKDYKSVDGTLNAVIVIETNAGAKVGGTIGFKVTDVNSTAKDVDLGNYKAYTYDVVAYDGTAAKITAKWGTKDYNYEGKPVEISKFKIKAPDDSAILVNSFTLTNTNPSIGTRLDIYDNIDADDVEVTIDGKTVKANVSINKDEEMTVSLKDSLEIAAKAQVEVIIEASLNSDFEDYGRFVKLAIAKSSDISATDKNNARITVDTTSAKWVEYQINGGQVKITNNKLGNVEASINSTDILIAAGEISIGEDLEKGTLTVTVTAGNGKAIEAMKLSIAGDDYDGTPDATNTNWTFSNIEITESGKIRLYVDTVDNVAYKDMVLQFSISGWNTLKYTNGDSSANVDISGSLTISKLTLTPAEGTLTNNLKSSDDIEFTNKEFNTEVVFEWTYKADKQDIKLNSFTIEWANAAASKIKFYLYVDDMNTSIADVTLASWAPAGTKASDTFKDVLVENGKEVKVKVEAEIDANEAALPLKVGKFKVVLDGEDENDNDAGHAERNTSNIVIVDKGTVSVTDSSTAKAVLRKASSSTIAEFTVKPDGSSSVTLEEIEFDLAFTENTPYQGEVKLSVKDSNKKFNGGKINGNGTYKAEFSTDVDSNGVVVKVELDDELDGSVALTNLKVNGNPIKKEFTKKYVEAIVWFTDKSHGDSRTTFKLWLDKKDSASIENLEIQLADNSWVKINGWNEIKEGTPYEVNNHATAAQDVKAIKYTVNGGDAKPAVAWTFTAAVPTPAEVSFTVTAGSDITAAATAGSASLVAWWNYKTAVDNTTTNVVLVQATPAAYTYNAADFAAYTTLTAGSVTTPYDAGTATCVVPAWRTIDNTKWDTTDPTTMIEANCVAKAEAATAGSYITYDSTTYPDMFRIGMKEDGAKVYVEKVKN